MTQPSAKKMLLIGWDAADWNVINPLMDEGKMPNLEQLITNGVMGNLATLYPELSPMLWTSIATGKRAWKHGIYGFTEPIPSHRGIRPITSLSRKTKAIWNILSQNGKKSSIVGWWPSHPAEPINGVMVSNQYHRAHAPIDQPWPIRPGVVHPRRLEKNLAALRWHPQSLLPEHILAFVPNAGRVDQDKDRRLESIARIICDCSTVQSAALAIMLHEPWDFFAVYYDAIDHFSHGFMRYHPPRLDWVMKDEFEIYRQVVQKGYLYHDMMLGKLLAQAGDDTTVMIISDHGFHSDHRRPMQVPREPAGPAAEHRHHGIFVVKGPGIRKDHIIHGAGLLDICPTLLTLLGLPVGDDMDGRPLVEIFETPPKFKIIPSWDLVDGDAGLHPLGVQMDAVDNQQMLNQLIELGYIDRPHTDIEKTVSTCIRELEYNLARTYMDADRHVTAISILEKLYKKWPREFRFGLHLVHCLKAVARLPEARKILETIMTSKQSLAVEASEELHKFNQTHNGKTFTDLTEKEQQELRKLRSEATVNTASMEYLMGSLLYSEQRHTEALGHFKRAETLGFRKPQLYLQEGNLFLEMKLPGQANQAFEKAVTIDPENPQALLGLSLVFLAKKKNTESVDQALAAIGLEYHFPMAHYVLGVGLHRLGHIPEAVTALGIAVLQNPNFSLAYQRLAYIYKHRLKQEKESEYNRRLAREARRRVKAMKTHDPGRISGHDPVLTTPSAIHTEAPARHRDSVHAGWDNVRNLSDTVVVVTGFPRSGTSLMMQMLEAGGLRLTADGARDPDESNPRGYYEDKRVKRLGVDNSWLAESRGSAVKIIAPLLTHLKPGLTYKIIFMERDSEELVRSQSRMLEKSGEKGSAHSEHGLAAIFARQIAAMKKLLTRLNLPVLYINYRTCVLEPGAAADQVNHFLGGSLDVPVMAEAVHPELYRERGSSY